MKKSTPTRSLLKAAIANCDISIEAYKGDKNPQVRELLIKAIAERAAFESVLLHLRGDGVYLRIYANQD